jgi:hypothetical protein
MGHFILARFLATGVVIESLSDCRDEICGGGATSRSEKDLSVFTRSAILALIIV